MAALHYSGAGTAYVAARHVQGAIVFMYHSVAEPDAAQWIDSRNHIPAEGFQRHVRFLARHRSVVSMTELVDAVAGGRSLPAGTVVLTFDDGYLDNLTVAAPILARYRLPATLYLATGYVREGKPQWVDRLYSAFRARSQETLWLDEPAPRRFALRSPRAVLAAYHLLCRSLLVADLAKREAILQATEDQLAPTEPPPRLTMTWDDVRQLRKCHPMFEIGVHTCDHLDLSVHSGEVARAQLEEPVAEIERELGIQPRHFSFPYSRSAADTGELVARTGFRSAVVAEEGVLIGAGADPLALARIPAPRSMALFRFMSSGAYPGLPRALFGRA